MKGDVKKASMLFDHRIDKEENKKHFYSVKTIADFIKNNIQ